MEPRRILIPAFHRIRASAVRIGTSHRPELGFASGRYVHVCSLGPNARDYILLYGPLAANVGGHTLLRCKSYVRASEEYAAVGAFVKDIVAGAVKSIV
ncbi:hypothetical protein RHSIM_Rhsim02G0097900 [Rhododendron simsii]|uniref:Uncharacterized protein n=1 Tax=Rhododendron simsii TaxID=118357 RepID=A0A834HCJ5_RHOSS|nr:hypothetical protein RHSIM_Rhsim02G0097900 [Rhododendron simsii]